MQNAARARIRNLINWLAAGRRTRSQSAAADTNPELISSAGKCVDGLRKYRSQHFLSLQTLKFGARLPQIWIWITWFVLSLLVGVLLATLNTFITNKVKLHAFNN
jgi:hypothetical protein